MKNKLSIFILVAIGLSLVLGCGISERLQKAVEGDSKTTKSNDGKTNPTSETITDKAIDAVADGETTGIPECDAVIQIFENESKTPEDNWIIKASRDAAVGIIKKSFRESLEQNKEDKTKMTENCIYYKTKLDKYLAEEKAKVKE